MGYRIEWTKRCVNVVYFGECSETEVLTAVVEIQSDFRFDSTHRALHNFDQCRRLNPSPEHLEELAVRNVGAAVTNPRFRIAVVTTHPEVLAMLERFRLLELSPYPLRVFSTVDEARVWLEAVPAA